MSVVREIKDVDPPDEGFRWQLHETNFPTGATFRLESTPSRIPSHKVDGLERFYLTGRRPPSFRGQCFPRVRIVPEIPERLGF